MWIDFSDSSAETSTQINNPVPKETNVNGCNDTYVITGRDDLDVSKSLENGGKTFTLKRKNSLISTLKKMIICTGER